jgi:transposase-like protein
MNEQVPAGKGREVEVVAVARRRQFSTAYKRQIVRKAAACEAVGGIGKLLRQEGLYSSHLATWRRELEADEHAALAPKRRGPKVDVAKAEARRVAVLEREVNRLRLKLTHAEPGKTAQSTSYLWVQQSGERDRPVVLYDYAPTRSGEVPKALLGDFRGYLQTDGYAGYHAVVATNGLVPVYCWAHARRYFVDALKAQGLNPNKLPTKPPDKARRPLKALTFIRHLYAIEARLRDRPPDERQARRQTESVPVLNDCRAWLDSLLPKVLPGSPLGTASTVQIA